MVKPNTKDLIDLIRKEATEWLKEYPEAGLQEFINCRVVGAIKGWIMADVEPYLSRNSQSVSEGDLKLVIHDEGHDFFTICQDLSNDECMILLELPKGKEEEAHAFIDFLKPYLSRNSQSVDEGDYIFIGYSSLGYEYGKQYSLSINRKPAKGYESCPITIQREDGTGVCPYSSIESFWNNWSKTQPTKDSREDRNAVVDECTRLVETQ